MQGGSDKRQLSGMAATSQPSARPAPSARMAAAVQVGCMHAKCTPPCMHTCTMRTHAHSHGWPCRRPNCAVSVATPVCCRISACVPGRATTLVPAPAELSTRACPCRTLHRACPCRVLHSGLLLQNSPPGLPLQNSPPGLPPQNSPLGPALHGSPLMPVLKDSPLGPVLKGSPLVPVLKGSPLGPVLKGSPLVPVLKDSPLVPVLKDSPLGPVLQDSPRLGLLCEQPGGWAFRPVVPCAGSAAQKHTTPASAAAAMNRRRRRRRGSEPSAVLLGGSDGHVDSPAASPAPAVAGHDPAGRVSDVGSAQQDAQPAVATPARAGLPAAEHSSYPASPRTAGTDAASPPPEPAGASSAHGVRPGAGPASKAGAAPGSKAGAVSGSKAGAVPGSALGPKAGAKASVAAPAPSANARPPLGHGRPKSVPSAPDVSAVVKATSRQLPGVTPTDVGWGLQVRLARGRLLKGAGVARDIAHSSAEFHIRGIPGQSKRLSQGPSKAGVQGRPGKDVPS
eukprot:358075-Chlamydomonas_euryale.AAC.10